MPDLEESITEWRRQMLAAGIKTPVPLEELESHLREDVERQMRSGVSAQEAFAAAVQRIGQAGALKAEFIKVGGTRRLLCWNRGRLANLLCWGTAGIAITSVAVAMGAFLLFTNKAPASSLERNLGLLAVASGIWIYFASWPWLRFLPVIAHKRARIAVQLAWGIPSFFFLLRFIVVSVSLVAQAAPTDWAKMINGESDFVDVFCQLLAAVNGSAIPSIANWGLYFVLSMIAFSIYFGIEETAQRRAATAPA